ncbi:hypothetical protein ACQJBY_004745 [Aegilops geniculata]
MVMRGNKSNVKTLELILVVVRLVALEQTQQAQTNVCCVFMSQSYYYWTCREVAQSSIETCSGLPLVSGHIWDNGCTSPYVNPEIPHIQAAADYHETTINYRKLGRTSSVCNKITCGALGNLFYVV